MGKNNFIFVYLDPPKSREERQREKEAARQRKLQKKREKEIQKENDRIRMQLLTCKEIIWLLEHEGSNKISRRKISATISLFALLLSIIVIIASFVCGSGRVLGAGIIMFVFAYPCWAQNSQVHADAKRIIADSLDQEYLDNYISKHGEIK